MLAVAYTIARHVFLEPNELKAIGKCRVSNELKAIGKSL
jgi:hypothetical protein